MRKIQTVLVFAACFLFVTATVTAQKAKNIMTNADVIEMVKAELPESTIVLAIQQCDPNFDTSTKALIELKKQGVPQKVMDAMFQPPIIIDKTQTKTRPPEIANAIATKDIGPLRVVLKSVLPIKDGYDRAGIRCNFEFISLETQKPLVVGLNALAGGSKELRSNLVDENGGIWQLVKDNVLGGISKISVGVQPNGNYYDPAEIITVLSKRDDLKSDVTSNQSNPFIYGSMTELAPEQSVAVTMIFIQYNNSNSTAPMKVFQMATEIVVGSLTLGSKKSYTLYNVTFDRISR